MNKRKLSIGLVSGIIGALALTGCNEVTADKDAVVSFIGADGTRSTIVTNEIYNKYRDTADGISKFYNAILETLVRYEFKTAEKTVWNKTYNEIKSEAENNVKNAKNEADENHTTNGTSYDEEWEKILSSYGVEDENGLLEYFIYQLEKSEVTDKYFNNNKSSLVKQYIGVKNDGTKESDTIMGTFPYHIRHVLVSVSGGSTNYYNGTISQSEGKTLGDTMTALLDKSYSFADVARKFSGDTGSGAKGGDVGIMTTTTSFVNEFKLGIYAYDAIYGKNSAKADSSEAILEGLGLSEDVEVEGVKQSVKTYWAGRELVKVPYGAFAKIGELYDCELDASGKQVNDGNSMYYPRNVLWNLYLNHHDPFVITNQVLDDNGNLIDGAANDRFNADGYLCDEKGNIIIGVRSEHGIHLMITQKSILDYDIQDGTDDKVSLNEYYTTAVEGEEGYPTTSEGVNKSTYVNYIKTDDKSVQTSRASEIKSAIKGFDSTYDYRLYEEYVNGSLKGKIVFNGEGELNLGAKIENYITRTKEANRRSAVDNLNSSWSTYIEQIEVQDANRVLPTYKDEAEGTVEDYNFRLIPARCAVSFKSHTGSAWSYGGACYYAK